MSIGVVVMRKVEVIINTNLNKNVCPISWHVPTDGDFTALETYLGGVLVAGKKMKESGLAHWYAPNTGTNESGFAGLPGSYRLYDGTFVDNFGLAGFWWSSTDAGSNFAWYRLLYFGANSVDRFSDLHKGSGLSIRCLKD